MNNDADSFVDQRGNQGDNGSFYQIEGRYAHKGKGPYVGDSRIDGGSGGYNRVQRHEIGVKRNHNQGV